MTQLGIIVGLGILLDTFVVRTLVIPALFALIGPAIWWPSLSERSGQRPQPEPAAAAKSAPTANDSG
jgi:putative drug exporter of the RND superfamily